MSKQILFPIFPLCILGFVLYPTMPSMPPPASLPAEATQPGGACTAFCLDNGDGCVFGANQDNLLQMGMLFVNKRNVLKTNWTAGTSGKVALWISRYGSVTINLVGYQIAWAGMNEAGLMLSTMSLAETQEPAPDERPPFPGGLWMQYQLDNHNSIEQVITSDADIRLDNSAVDHYLVCDRTGACAVIEFLDGKMVAYTGSSLPVRVLTNSTYQDSLLALEDGQYWKVQAFAVDPGGPAARAGIQKGDWIIAVDGVELAGEQSSDFLTRFVTATRMVERFEPAGSEKAVAYAFDTLKAVSRADTVWSFVYDPVHMRVHFRTNDNPNIRYVDLSSLDFSCKTPVKLMDVHADLSGDASELFGAYTHQASFTHTRNFFSQYPGANIPPLLADTLLWGLESFPCQDGVNSTQTGGTHYRPVISPTVKWVGLMLLHRAGPFWILLVVLSLVLIAWRMALGYPASAGQRLVWVLVTILLGPLGFPAYLLNQRKKRQSLKSELAE